MNLHKHPLSHRRPGSSPLSVVGMTGFLALALSFAPLPGFAAKKAESPEAIIKKVDEIRNPAESYFMKVRIKNSDSNTPSVFSVSLSGNSKTLVKTLSPARDQGKNYLMLDQDMWAYLPNLGRAVRVSLSQKLTGQASNGDISRMRWSGDYTPVIEKQEPKDWVLLLTANKKGLTYEKVRVWVQKSTYYPLHAEFLTASGKPLKKAVYGAYKKLCGRMRPTEMLIQDAIRSSDRSLMTILEMQPRHFPGSLFNPKAMEDDE